MEKNIMDKTPIFIAEIKTQSPFGFKSTYPFVSLMNYAIQYGDWISVHTNALWGGDFDAISFVRRNTNKPILAKGFHATDADIGKALECGADYVLVVDRLPSYGYLSHCLLEIHDRKLRDTIFEFPSSKHMKFVSNSRNLSTGLPKKWFELPDYINKDLWICQASGIRSQNDVYPNVDAFIVGEYLVEYCKNIKPKNNYYVHINSGNSAFVKDEAYFIEQGGLTEPWGKHWKLIRAEDIEDARSICKSKYTREDFI